MHSILSDITYIDKSNVSVEEIETCLAQQYGSVVRWAIVGIDDKNLKINVTYEARA